MLSADVIDNYSLRHLVAELLQSQIDAEPTCGHTVNRMCLDKLPLSLPAWTGNVSGHCLHYKVSAAVTHRSDTGDV